MTSQKKPREFFIEISDGYRPRVFELPDRPPDLKGYLHVREVLSDERDAEIAKLREALKVAREGLEYSKRKQQPVEMEEEKWVLLDYINYTIRNSNEALTRIQSIMGDKESKNV